jgi:hypothetical protein
MEEDHIDHVHTWLDFDDSRIEDLASFLADAIARRQTEGAPGLYERWDARRTGGPTHDADTTFGLTKLLGLVVGTPALPRSADKIQAVVAEHLWYVIQKEKPDLLGREDVLCQGPSLRVEDHGSDGLVIFRSVDGDLNVRLWEIKKRNPAGDLRPTVREACKQLTDSGFIYLAQASETIQGQRQPIEVRAFAAQMAALWQKKDAKAHAGVAIKAARGSRAPNTFASMPEFLPGLDGTARRVGYAIESGQFTELADRVRDILWSGL